MTQIRPPYTLAVSTHIQELSWDSEDIVGVQRIDAKKGGYGRSNSEYLVRNQVQASGSQPARFCCAG